MTKYLDKMRLKQWIAREGEVDDLTRWLILQGYTDTMAKNGLVCFVEAWEASVRDIFLYGSSCTEEWYHDIWPREELAKILLHTPPDQVQQLMPRIERADHWFKELTVEGNQSIDDDMRTEEGREVWWLFRWPK